jgi:hypothetical protein
MERRVEGPIRRPENAKRPQRHVLKAGAAVVLSCMVRLVGVISIHQSAIFYTGTDEPQ